MKTWTGKPIAPHLLDQLDALAPHPETAIDFSDAPEIADWTGAVRSGLYRPVKKACSLRLDADLIAWFKAGGDGYQTRINAALRDYVGRHSKG